MDALIAEYGEEDVMRWCETGRLVEKAARHEYAGTLWVYNPDGTFVCLPVVNRAIDLAALQAEQE